MADIHPFPSNDGGNPGDGGSDPVAERLLVQLRPALASPSRWVLVPLVVLAAVQVVIVVPWLVGRDPWRLLGGTEAGHVTRDGALGLVIAAAALIVAWRPRWALPSFTLASLVLIVQAVVGAFDVADGVSGAMANELIHVPSVILTCLIGLAATPLRSLGPTHRHPGV